MRITNSVSFLRACSVAVAVTAAVLGQCGVARADIIDEWGTLTVPTPAPELTPAVLDPKTTALLILIVVLFTFAFSHESLDGNFNYICPYSYETVHGLYLSVLTIAFLCQWIDSGRLLWAVLAGLVVPVSSGRLRRFLALLDPR